MDYTFSKSFILTHNLKIRVYDWQTRVKIAIENTTTNQSIDLDVDGWTEFKKCFLAIDEEYKKRFNYQYSIL